MACCGAACLAIHLATPNKSRSERNLLSRAAGINVREQVSKPVPEPFRFEEYDLDIERYELRRSCQAVKLERIPMELLILLLQNNGKLVRRDAINRRLWGEQAYQDTDHSVNTAVNKLRYILRDDPRDPRFIQTVVGQGYRFIAEVAADPFLEDVAIPLPGTQRGEAKQRTVSNGAEFHQPEPVETPTAQVPLPVTAVPAENIGQ